MKRRTFIKTTSGITASLAVPGFIACTGKRNAPSWQSAHNSSSLESIIAIDELERPVTVLQISDSHITREDERGKDFEQYSKRMGGAYAHVKHYKTLEPTTPYDCFVDLLQLAKDKKVDLIALTGDILNYPAELAVETVGQMVRETGIPHLYVAGNHDWHYEGMEGSSDSLRREWCERRLKPLYTGNMFFSSTIMGGINMVTIDNSTYQVNEEQLEFYRQQCSRPEPVALFMHIPLYMPTMEICCGHPQWGAATDDDYETERRQRWPENGNSPSTVEFVQQVMKTERLAGIFTGHWHQSRTVVYQDKVQYLAGPALKGEYRMIRFVPYAG